MAVAAALTLVLGASLPAHAAWLVQVSQDPYTGAAGQHRTEVEPDTFAFGSTIVSAFQVGRIFDGGSANIGWATSTDGGASWTNGFMPGITTVEGGIYPRVSDPSVAYDARHGVWMVSSLALVEPPAGHEVVVSRSVDGGLTWQNPTSVYLATGSQDLDKNWTACDNWLSSPFYGNCYTEFDNHGDLNRLEMSTSSDGGLTWSAPVEPQGRPTGLGGQPLARPDGTVVVATANANETAIIAFSSTDGGTTWGPAVTISNVRQSTVHGNLRTGPLPSAGVDGDGTVYVVWQDCRFENPNCGTFFNNAPHDIVMSTSGDGGLTWSALTLIPIDPVGSGVDHFIPGLAVDRTTQAPNVSLGLAYYFYPDWTCSPATCQLLVGFIKSADGGGTWTGPTVLTDTAMNTSWLANTSQGRMVGDYIRTAHVDDGTAHTVIAVANPPGDLFDEAMYTTGTGLAPGRGSGLRVAQHAPRDLTPAAGAAAALLTAR